MSSWRHGVRAETVNSLGSPASSRPAPEGGVTARASTQASRSRRRAAATAALTALLLLAACWSVGIAAAGGPRSAATAGTVVVARLGSGAQGIRLAAGSDDLYVVDAASGHVERYILHGLPHAELFTQVMRWKEGANGLIMGRPLDLYLVGGRLLILDDLASLWSYQGSDYQRTLVALRVQSWQGRLDAVAVHGSALLVLDRDRRQVWSYRAASGGYDTVPRGLLPRPLVALAAASRLAASQSALLTIAHGAVLAIPWNHLAAWRELRLGGTVTGVWATESRRRFLVSFARSVAICTPRGQVDLRVAVRGLQGQTIRDLALDPAGRLYVLTATRILRLTTTLPPL